MKTAIISFFTILLGGSLIVLISGIASGDITIMNLVPMSIHGIVVLLAISIVVKNGIHVSEDKLVIAIQITGMILALLGFGTIFLQEYLPIPIEMIWASLVGLIMLMSSKYIEFYRMMHRTEKK